MCSIDDGFNRTIGLFSATDRTWELIRNSAVSYCLTAFCLIVLVWAALKFRSWYQDDSDPAADRSELLLQFDDLRRRGDLTEEEFRSIQGQLVDESPDSSVDDPETSDITPQS